MLELGRSPQVSQRARDKLDIFDVILGTVEKISPTPRPVSIKSTTSKLSADSLEALSTEVDQHDPAAQPPLEAYLASSSRDEAADLVDIQSAVDTATYSELGSFAVGSSSGSRIARSSSVITSLTSSEGSAPTSYTVSSGGSDMSSFGRERRRGRRRMSWRDSPYSRPKADRINDAGLPSRNLPFFCTFCPRAFRTKYEWTRHEDSVHALRTTWICCSTKQGPLAVCPFCGRKAPDEVHLAGHKYQQCQNKPEAHRTFYRRDHFIQHLHHVHFANEKHPTPQLGCGTRKNSRQTQLEWGCQTLALKWRKFGAPMKRDDPMLHCGFCGKTSKDWATRCDHVAEHLLAGGWDRSGWWSERKETHMNNLCDPRAAGPFRCRYCQKVFANAGGMKGHSTCQVWSCRLLRTFDDVASANSGPPLCPQFPSPKAHHCHLCGAGYKSSHIEHAHQYHKYRQCSQELYTSKEDFLQHLHEFHGASHPLLLMQNGVLEQHFSRIKGASFEPLDFDEILQGCRVAGETETFVDPFAAYDRPCTAMSCDGEMDWTDSLIAPPTRSRPRERERDQLSDVASIATTHTTNQTHPHTQHKNNRVNSEYMGPRIFRLDPLVPFLSSRVYYLKKARMAELFGDGKALLQEVEKGHVASLVMASGLVGMAACRVQVGVKRDDERGVIEFGVDD